MLKYVNLILILILIKLVIWGVSPFQLAGDEALFWLYTKYMALAYYTKGPVIAWVVKAGTWLFGDTEFGVRFGSLVCSVIFTTIFCTYAHTLFPRNAWKTCLLLFTSPFFLSLGIGATTDPACFMFWLAGILCAWEAIEGRKWLWLLAWSSFGLAVLTKYSTLAGPVSLFIYLIWYRKKDVLFSPLFWSGIVMFLICLSPVLVWNYQNHWVNFAHNAGHLGVQGKSAINFFGPFETATTLLVVLGVFGGVLLLKDNYLARGTPFNQFMVCMAFPLASACLIASLFHEIYPNWSIPIGFMLALGALPATSKQGRWFNVAISTNIVIVTIAALLLCDIHPGIAQTKLGTRKLVGWKLLGERVAALHQADEFVITNRYDVASLIAFYTTPRVFVTTASDELRRMNEFDLWTDWNSLVGKDAILVLRTAEIPPSLASSFETIEPLGNKLDINDRGVLVRSFYFFRGSNFIQARWRKPDVF